MPQLSFFQRIRNIFNLAMNYPSPDCQNAKVTISMLATSVEDQVGLLILVSYYDHRNFAHQTANSIAVLWKSVLNKEAILRGEKDSPENLILGLKLAASEAAKDMTSDEDIESVVNHFVGKYVLEA